MARQQVEIQADIEEGMNLPEDMAGNLDRAAKCIETVSDFAQVIDWRCEVPSPLHEFPEDISMTMSENDQALRAGSYVTFNILPTDGSMRMQGGYYDGYHQPNILCETFFPLHNGSSQELESSLSSMCQILQKYHRTFVTPLVRT